MKTPVRIPEVLSGIKGGLTGPFGESRSADPESSAPAGRQEVRKEIHRVNAPRQSQRPAKAAAVPERMHSAMVATPFSLPTPKQNQILAALPAADYKRLLSALEFVELPLGHVLYEPDTVMTHAFFPVTGIISMLYVMLSGESAEIAIAGNESMIGVSLFMGGESTTSSTVVQNAGAGYRLKAGILRREFALGGALQLLLLRYTQALMTQMTQTAACNRHHTLDQQLCRWLLLSLDRLSGAP